MVEYIELIDKYRIIQSKDTDYNPPSYEWVDNTGEIIRCCDCKHFQINVSPSGYLPQGVPEWECRHWCRPTDPTDFCSYGEKRGGKTDV